MGDALARRSASVRRRGDTEIAGWREKNGQFLNSMRHALCAMPRREG